MDLFKLFIYINIGLAFILALGGPYSMIMGGPLVEAMLISLTAGMFLSFAFAFLIISILQEIKEKCH